MANTSALQEAIQWVRGELGRQRGMQFEKGTVALQTGRLHTFNAVSVDGSVVATVMNSSGATSGGNKPTGKIRNAIAELYFLSLVKASHRELVVTNRSFMSILQSELDGALAEGLFLRHVELPARLSLSVAQISEAASDEMTM